MATAVEGTNAAMSENAGVGVDTVSTETNVQEQTEMKKPEAKPASASGEPSVQDLMVEIAKLKRAVDRSTSEAADYKKKWKETLSSQEQASIEKAEAEAAKDERLKELERLHQIHEFTENFMELGYEKDLAKQAAAAQADGDTEALFKIQKQVQDAQQKSWEAEFLKTRPQVNSGVGAEGTTVTKEEFDKMGYTARLEFKQKYPETYEQYTKR